MAMGEKLLRYLDRHLTSNVSSGNKVIFWIATVLGTMRERITAIAQKSDIAQNTAIFC